MGVGKIGIENEISMPRIEDSFQMMNIEYDECG
jgi:hypothetical protein